MHIAYFFSEKKMLSSFNSKVDFVCFIFFFLSSVRNLCYVFWSATFPAQFSNEWLKLYDTSGTTVVINDKARLCRTQTTQVDEFYAFNPSIH